MHSHCASCLRHAFPSLRCALRSFTVPLRFQSWPISALHFLCLSYLCYAFPSHRESVHCLSFANQINAGLCHAFASRISSQPRFSFAVPSYAVPLLFCSKPSHSIAVRCKAALRFSFAIPRLAFASLLYAAPRISFAFPFPRSALLFLCFSMQRYSLPINSFAGRFTAMMFPCKSLYCSANPLQINSWLCAAFALLSCALPCHPLLCPCAADQETSAQRKRPLPELRH